jgi:hypothetical protein
MLVVDMTSNQNAPSTKGVDSYWLMGILTKATSNQISPSTKGGDFIGGILSLGLVTRHKKLIHDTKARSRIMHCCSHSLCTGTIASSSALSSENDRKRIVPTFGTWCSGVETSCTLTS